MTEVLEEELPGHPCGVLTGPNLAKEILAGHAAATVVAMEDNTIAEAIKEVFSTDLFRVYTNNDVIGCEVAEIGRASCRERVCTYVEISVVAVSLKKNKQE